MRSVVAHGRDEIVAVGEGGPRTAAALAADAARVAAALGAHAPGEVLLLCDDRYRFAAGLLGAWAAGHAVRLPPNGQPETVRAMAAEDGVRAFLHDRPGAAEGTPVQELLAGPVPPGELALPPLSRPLVTILTSGSTGAHRRWVKTGEQLVGEALLLGRHFDVQPGAQVLSTVPPHHIYGLLFGVLLPLGARAAMVREGPLHAEAVAAAIAVRGVTHLVSVPAHLAALVEAERLPPLARVFSSGAPLPAAVADGLRARHGQAVVEVYGSTETGGIGWREGSDQPWTPFPDATVAVDPEGALLVSSPRLGPDLPRPFVCADRVELLPTGGFRLLGRADGVVKVGGKRVSLREIEERLLSLPGVSDAAALAAPSAGARGVEIWVAAVAPGWTPAVLRERLLAWLDPVTVPRRIRVVPALPREATGKLVRERLRAMLEAPAPAPRLDFTMDGEEVLPAEAGCEARRVTVTVPADLHWFQGHFPGYPLLPGVIQLERLVLRQAARIWPALGAPSGVRRLKFSRPISPGARVALTLRLEAARGLVHFEISGDGGPHASGALVFAGGSP